MLRCAPFSMTKQRHPSFCVIPSVARNPARMLRFVQHIKRKTEGVQDKHAFFVEPTLRGAV